jgi:hypothetical protein
MIKPGDLVVIRGFPTVVNVESIEDDSATCIWFDNAGCLQRETIKLIVLDLVMFIKNEDYKPPEIEEGEEWKE